VTMVCRVGCDGLATSRWNVAFGMSCRLPCNNELFFDYIRRLTSLVVFVQAAEKSTDSGLKPRIWSNFRRFLGKSH